jgi:DNA-binding transcriptional LysR family regulator
MARQMDALSPENLRMLRVIADRGSMSAAARALNLVPSALSYRVRQLEHALDVLLLDRSHKNAVLTPAGLELLREGWRLLQELQALAQRVKRVATGWEPEFTIALDGIIWKPTVMELIARFLQLDAPTRLRVRDETLSGTWHALLDGKADLAIGVPVDSAIAGYATKALGNVGFVFAVAPHHALAQYQGAISDSELLNHRIVTSADSTTRAQTVSVGVLRGQAVLTMPTLSAKLDAQLRGLGCGFLPECMARPYLDTGRLVEKATERAPRVIRVSYAWSESQARQRGRALSWWLEQLRDAKLQAALLHGAR